MDPAREVATDHLLRLSWALDGNCASCDCAGRKATEPDYNPLVCTCACHKRGRRLAAARSGWASICQQEPTAQPWPDLSQPQQERLQLLVDRLHAGQPISTADLRPHQALAFADGALPIYRAAGWYPPVVPPPPMPDHPMLTKAADLLCRARTAVGPDCTELEDVAGWLVELHQLRQQDGQAGADVMLDRVAHMVVATGRDLGIIPQIDPGDAGDTPANRISDVVAHMVDMIVTGADVLDVVSGEMLDRLLYARHGRRRDAGQTDTDVRAWIAQQRSLVTVESPVLTADPDRLVSHLVASLRVSRGDLGDGDLVASLRALADTSAARALQATAAGEVHATLTLLQVAHTAEGVASLLDCRAQVQQARARDNADAFQFRDVGRQLATLDDAAWAALRQLLDQVLVGALDWRRISVLEGMDRARLGARPAAGG